MSITFFFTAHYHEIFFFLGSLEVISIQYMQCPNQRSDLFVAYVSYPFPQKVPIGNLSSLHYPVVANMNRIPSTRLV